MKKLAKTSGPQYRFPELRPSREIPVRSPIAGHSVHVIESDEEELMFVCDFLSIAGLRVSGSTDPARGLKSIARTRPEILISNLAELEMGGDEFLDRARKASPGTRLILISNWLGQPAERCGRAEYGVDFLIGPFNAVGLLRAVEQILASASQGDPVSRSGRLA